MKFLIVFAAIAVCAVAQTPCQNIRTRSQWGSRTTNLTWLPSNPPPGFVVHHTFMPRCATQAACDQQMRDIQNFHMNTNGWADTGYNFCVGDNGQIYEGRGYGRQGAHAPGFNARSLGFCFFGDHTNVLPTAAALNAARAFIDCSRANNMLTSTHWVSTHRQDRQSNTACPGQALQNNVVTWPRYNANP